MVSGGQVSAVENSSREGSTSPKTHRLGGCLDRGRTIPTFVKIDRVVQQINSPASGRFDAEDFDAAAA